MNGWLWLGHHASRMLWVFLALVFAMAAVGSRITAGRVSFEAGPVLYWTVAAAAATAAVVWLVSQMAEFSHDCRLCERCVAESPLDPEKAVSRSRWLLWLSHSAVVVAIVCGCSLVAVFVPLMLLSRHAPGWVFFMMAAGLIPPAICAAAERRHRALYPWCPFCSWGDGGDYEPSPDPDPAVSR